MYQHPPPRADLTAPALSDVTEFAFSNVFRRDCLIASANSTLMTSHEQIHRLGASMALRYRKGDLSTDLHSGSTTGLVQPKLLLDMAIGLRMRMYPDLSALCLTVFE